MSVRPSPQITTVVVGIEGKFFDVQAGRVFLHPPGHSIVLTARDQSRTRA
jgi:hypothetical protein